MAKVVTPIAYRELWVPARHKVYWGGRGAGKSYAFADTLAIEADMKPLRILCAREKQNSIRESVHALLASRIHRHGLDHRYEITDKAIINRFTGSRFFFVGLWNNFDSIKSIEGVDRCWVEEANSVSQYSLDTLIPTIRKPGSEIWMSFNVRLKSDPAYQKYIVNKPPPRSIVRKVGWRDNPWFTEELRMEMEHDYEIDPQRARHIWEGEPLEYADGAIYRDQLTKAREQGRITKVPYQPHAEVHTFWDLGRRDKTSIWFMQEIGREKHFIDYYEANNVELDHYARFLKSKPYNYGRHYLPHDVEVTELSSNRGSRRDILESAGVRPIITVPRTNSVADGIEATRAMFPTCWFDEDACALGLDGLADYHYEYDERSRTYGLTPAKSAGIHAADAFRQCAQGYTPRVSLDYSQFQPDPRYFE